MERYEDRHVQILLKANCGPNRACGRPRSQGSAPNVPLVTW
jgi:hypothetical protein